MNEIGILKLALRNRSLLNSPFRKVNRTLNAIKKCRYLSTKLETVKQQNQQREATPETTTVTAAAAKTTVNINDNPMGIEMETFLDSSWKEVKVDYRALPGYYSKLSKRNLTGKYLTHTNVNICFYNKEKKLFSLKRSSSQPQ